MEAAVKQQGNSKLEVGWAIAITAFLGLSMLILDHFWGDYLVGHESQLHRAVSVCDFARVEKLLKEGADPNEYRHRPPLYFTGKCQPPLKMEKLLLEAGADPNPLIDPEFSDAEPLITRLKRRPAENRERIKLLESYLEERANQSEKKKE